MGVYTLFFDLLLLVVTWTSNWHELIFRNVRYELVNGSYELLYEYGQLHMFVILGCELVPLILAMLMLVSYLSKEWVARLRRQAVLMFLVLFHMTLLYHRNLN